MCVKISAHYFLQILQSVGRSLSCPIVSLNVGKDRLHTHSFTLTLTKRFEYTMRLVLFHIIRSIGTNRQAVVHIIVVVVEVAIVDRARIIIVVAGRPNPKTRDDVRLVSMCDRFKRIMIGRHKFSDSDFDHF